jgi:hypothetical protein
MIDPAAPAPIGNMGQPIPRYDARAKVTGKALYAADMALPGVAYAYLLSSRIAKGRIKSFDLKAARALPGVLDILTYQTIGGDIRKVKYATEGGPASNSVVPLGSAEITYAGQTIAVVLAETRKSPKAPPPKLASSTRSSRRPEHSIRKGRLNRNSLGRTRNTMIPRLAISRRLMTPLPLKLTPDIRLRPSTTTRSNCSLPNASGMARS